MEISLGKSEAEFYSKLYVSSLDFEFAAFCLGMLLKKGWHHKPWERRGTIYEQQSAFTLACVVAYSRPFTRSKGWPRFPVTLVDFDVQESELHEQILELRHSVYAHSDSKNYTVKPWRAGGFSTDIIGAPWQRITREEALLLQRMIRKLQKAIRGKSEELCPRGSTVSDG
jgi:hypothetical protein